MNERMNERMNKRMNEKMNERMNERMKEKEGVVWIVNCELQRYRTWMKVNSDK